MFRVLVGEGTWAADPLVPRIPFAAEDAAVTRKLRFGVMTQDGFFKPHAATARAVSEAADALRAAGHEVVAWEPQALGIDTYRAGLLFYGLVGADGNFRSFYEGLEVRCEAAASPPPPPRASPRPPSTGRAKS